MSLRTSFLSHGTLKTHFSIQHRDRNITTYKFGTTWFRVNNDRILIYGFVIPLRCNQAELVRKPWSADTNVSWHATMSKHMPEHENNKCSFVLMSPQKSSFVAWHRRDTSTTQTRKEGQNLCVPRFRIRREFQNMKHGWSVRCGRMWNFTKSHEHRGMLGYSNLNVMEIW